MPTNGDGHAILTKATLIENIFNASNVPLKDAEIILECILGSMVRAIERGEKIEIRRCGTFGTRARGAHIGRNPRTGVPVNVPAKRIAFFKSSEALRAMILTKSEPWRGGTRWYLGIFRNRGLR